MTVPFSGGGIAPRQVELAMAIMVAAMLLLPAIDAIAKVLTATVPIGLIAWSRFFFQTIFLAPVALPRRRRWQSSFWRVHAARGVLLAATTLMFFAAIRVLPLADAISIFFVEPLLLALLSAVFLGEPIGWRRLTAIVIGFAGALLIVRPSYAVFGGNALLPLAAALSFALYLILTRRFAPREDPITMQFLAGVYGVVVMSVGLATGAYFGIPELDPAWPNAREWVLLFGVGIVATVGHVMVVHAFRRAEASILAPFQYLEIIGATGYGYVLFGNFPDPLTWGGIAIIIGSGIYVFHRERVLARSPAS